MNRARVDEKVAGGMRLFHALWVALSLKRNQAVARCRFLYVDLLARLNAVTVPPACETRCRVSRSLAVSAPAGSACSRSEEEEQTNTATSLAAATSPITLRVSSSLDTALRFGTQEIFNTDQGAQFTSTAFTERVRACGALCSMDGRGRYLDNIFIERLWRSLKYEAVYLHDLADARDAERIIGSWFRFYGESRPHSSLGGRTPGGVHRGALGEVA